MKKMIKRLKTKFFSSEDNKAWKAWVDLRSRNYKDLINLLSSEVRTEFKRRAIFLLLVPFDNFNNIYWKGSLGKFEHDSNFLKLIGSPAELDYAADLVFDFCSELKFKHIGRSKVSVFGGDGVTFYVPVMEKYHTPLSFYNSCIVEFLSLLPEEKARKLFSLFSLLDISTYSNIEYASGYNPFANLLSDENIAEHWKRLADFKMTLIVGNELSGKKKPREKWENAFSQYVHIFQAMLYGVPKYSKELYVRQIRFILEMSSHNPEIYDWQLIRIFKLLPNKEYKSIRYALAKYVLLEKNNSSPSFSIYNEETQFFADWVKKEFAHDNALLGRISFLEKERDERDLARKIIIETKKAQEDDANHSFSK